MSDSMSPGRTFAIWLPPSILGEGKVNFSLGEATVLWEVLPWVYFLSICLRVLIKTRRQLWGVEFCSPPY